MTFFLISHRVTIEKQMLVKAQNLIQAQTKALHPDNDHAWRELEPQVTWYAEALQMEGEEEEYPEVVE